MPKQLRDTNLTIFLTDLYILLLKEFQRRTWTEAPYQALNGNNFYHKIVVAPTTQWVAGNGKPKIPVRMSKKTSDSCSLDERTIFITDSESGPPQ